MDLLEQAKQILEYGPTCDHCLGRFFGKRSHGLSNDVRGRALRIGIALEDNLPYTGEQNECWICGRIFDKIDQFVTRTIEATDGIQFLTFLMGSRVPPLMAESEEIVWSDLGLEAPEPLKAEMNREVGKAVSARIAKEVDFLRPDVVIILDIGTGTVDVQINPIFVYGRYLKYERGIPQTRWHCRACRGKGCERCNFTGKMYLDSVEELIGRPLIPIFQAEDAILHGAGREDIDARMLGTGRPFVMEFVAPKRRLVTFEELENAVNRSAVGRVAVRFDHWSNRHEVETIKSQKGHKKYSISVEVDGAFSIEDIQKALIALSGVTIFQRTPERVAHRRSDLVRKRKVLEMKCVGKDDDRFLIEVVGEAGLYIKELISGDRGRTTPSLADVLGVPSRVIHLDVLMVEGVVPETNA